MGEGKIMSIFNIFNCKSLSKTDKFLAKTAQKLCGIKASDFAKKKKESEEGEFNKFDFAFHVDAMEEQLKKILNKKTFPKTIEMSIYDIEYGFKGTLIDRQTGLIKPIEFIHDEIPDILDYFKDAGFDIIYTNKNLPLEGTKGRFIFTIHYDD